MYQKANKLNFSWPTDYKYIFIHLLYMEIDWFLSKSLSVNFCAYIKYGFMATEKIQSTQALHWHTVHRWCWLSLCKIDT